MQILISLLTRFETFVFYSMLLGVAFYIGQMYLLAREFRRGTEGYMVSGLLIARCMPYYNYMVAGGMVFQLATIVLFLAAGLDRLLVVALIGVVCALVYNIIVVPLVERRFIGSALRAHR